MLFAQDQGRDLPTEAEWERAAAHGEYVERYCGYKETISETSPDNPGTTINVDKYHGAWCGT